MVLRCPTQHDQVERAGKSEEEEQQNITDNPFALFGESEMTASGANAGRHRAQVPAFDAVTQSAMEHCPLKKDLVEHKKTMQLNLTEFGTMWACH